MKTSGRLFVATQFYPPDKSTTATYLGQIARALASDNEVIVVSGTAGSRAPGAETTPEVVEVRSWSPKKRALVRRAIAICALAAGMFFAVLRRAGRNDTVFCVTTPFTLPYTVVLAAWLRGAATVLLIYDLYPEALEAAKFIQPTSISARLLRFANSLLFRTLDAIIVIGRDTPSLLTRYSGVLPTKIHFIPNWALIPIGYRELDPNNPFRASLRGKFVVGLSGNLGFTHDPKAVFEAAKLLAGDKDIHFLFAGWGVGWNELSELAASEQLANVTVMAPVPDDELVDFLSAADVWVIPYRQNIAGVSIPSRLYNLLAVGRPIIVCSESHSEAAIVLSEEAIGWVVPPEDPAQLARAIADAATDRSGTAAKGRQAAIVAHKYSKEAATKRYREIVGAAANRP
ncbi:glycosyltransferase family 4 protein [Bradyrhizobium sp. ISRA443]|uniref:glycosyltransferase family 4 protein n=1 Tax=unclassified Bradyrhizobium TaxID=2631580 RepID=UPI00247B27CC|nr:MULTISPECIES: glycosyltransferase family 4 protein [unclassified Bradyrhizobium]WGR92910.1 glycosyltransferase family 4 protein [Bradyrhizobium sp. ISRA435]WGR97408.1 glycosyltransferase family 4 protein [Bradyrhizobium sp. ISRA436]WGS04296.1 glycosyltransferase family 4 protein [Bradyrhizobium sp. ISRA437]WGS11180.1 glycosyltransferase family 4 protein [Bradyrhizobium sp. ISRA443]